MKFNKIYSIIVLMLTVMIISVSAYQPDLVWDEYNRNEFNAPTIEQQYENEIDASATIFKVSKSVGSDYQPFIVDMNDDEINELYVYDSGILNVYEFVGSTLQLMDQKALGTGQNGGYTLLGDIDNNGYDELLAYHNEDFYLIEYNINKSLVVVDKRDEPDYTPYQSPRCFQSDCFYPDENGNITYLEYDERDRYSAADEPETDGTWENLLSVAFIINENYSFSHDILLTEVDNITAYKFLLNKTSNGFGNYQDLELLYDISICPTTVTSLTATTTRGADCSGPQTLIMDDIEVALFAFGVPPNKWVTLPFDEPYQLSSDNNYIISFDYVSDNKLFNNVSGLSSTADASVTSNFYRRVANNSGVLSQFTAGYLLHTKLVGYSYNLETYDACNDLGSSECFNIEIGDQFTPTFNDYDNDGDIEMVTIADLDDDGNEGILVWNWNTKQRDNLFNGGLGIDDDMCGVNGFSYFGGLMISDAVFGGYDEIIFTCIFDGSFDGVRLIMADALGNPLISERIAPQSGTYTASAMDTTAPVESFYQGLDGLFCAVSRYDDGVSNYLSWFSCFDLAQKWSFNHDGFSDLAFRYSSGNLDGNQDIFFSSAGANIISARTSPDNDFNEYEIIAPNGIFDLDEDTNNSFDNIYNYSYTSTARGGSIAVADITNDDVWDVCYSDTGETYCAFVDIINNVPVISGSFGSSPSVANPVCVNTSVEFNALDCLQFPAACTYTNDRDTDEERIVTDCGLGGADTVGTYYNFNPSVNCYYNQTGTYSVTLYIQDEANPTDLSASETYAVNVINGLTGSTCNIGVSEPTSSGGTGGTGNNIDNDVSSVLDILFGTSPILKLIVGLSLVIGIMVLVVMKTGSALVGVAGGFVMLIMMTALGLVSVWILIVAIVAVIFGGILYSTVFRQSAG